MKPLIHIQIFAVISSIVRLQRVSLLYFLLIALALSQKTHPDTRRKEVQLTQILLISVMWKRIHKKADGIKKSSHTTSCIQQSIMMSGPLLFFLYV